MERFRTIIFVVPRALTSQNELNYCVHAFVFQQWTYFPLPLTVFSHRFRLIMSMNCAEATLLSLHRLKASVPSLPAVISVEL